MRTLRDSDRVRVFEPDPAMPSGALPVFGEFLDRFGKRVFRQVALSAVMTLLGVGLFFAGIGLAAPVSLVVLFGGYLAFWTYCAATCVPARRLKRVPFKAVDCAPDDLVVAGKVVGARLPEGRWLHVRFAAAARLQLAGQGRVWLLGSGDQIFAGLPGNLCLRRARIHDEPPAGASALPPVSREPTSPRLDPVFGAHRRYIATALWGFVAVYAAIAGLAVWVRVDLPSRLRILSTVVNIPLIVFGLLVLLLVKAATDSRKPVPADHWTELRLVLDGPIRIGGRGLARLSGTAMLADGREVGVRMVRIDPSMAANVAATGQLWIAGSPRRGRTSIIGVPGYPVTGIARFLR